MNARGDRPTSWLAARPRRWSRFLWVLAVGVLAVGGLAACGDDDDDAAGGNGGDGGGGDEDAASCESTVEGTELTYGVYAPAHAMDPTQASGALVGGTELLAVYDALMIYDYEDDSWEPHLAESLEPNDDFTTWTLTLRDDVEFSDGTPLTAEIVSENIDRFFADEVATNTSPGFLTPIVERNVIDETTLELQLDRSWAEFPFVFADEPGMIVNPNAVGDDVEAFAADPPESAGLGPYVVERNAPGEELVMVAKDDYWGGPVCIERLRFVFRPGTTYDAFRAGDLDAAFLRDPGDIDAARQSDEESFFVGQNSGEALMINHAEGRPGEDLRVREAIMLAVDPEVINERAFEGLLTTSKSIVGPDSRFYSDSIEPYPTDPDEAANRLDEAMADGYDGQIELLCTNSPAQRPDTALAVSSQLEAAGFDVEVTSIAQGDQIGQVAQGDFDLACWGVNAGPDTAITSFNRFLASDSATNRMAYANDDMDAALLDLFAAAGEEELQEAMAEVNEIFHRDAATLSYGHIEEGLVWDSAVEGIVPTGATMFMFHDAYFAE